MKGRWFLGLVSGFLFGLMLGVTLFLFGVIPLHSDWLWILPLLGIVLGLVMAAWAPFGGGGEEVPATSVAPATTAPVETTLEHDVVPDEPVDTSPEPTDDA